MFWPNWANRTPEERKGAEEPRAQFLAATEQVDVWIDPENNLLSIQRTLGSFPAVGDEEWYTSEATMEYSRYNEPFNIVAPSQEAILPAAR